MKTKSIYLVGLLLCSCDEMHKDHHYPLDDSKRMNLTVGQILTFQSQKGQILELEVIAVINGETVSSYGGSDFGGPFNFREFELTYLDFAGQTRSAETERQLANLQVMHFPSLPMVYNLPDCISIFRTQHGALVDWFGEFSSSIPKEFSAFHLKLKINERTFKNVFELGNRGSSLSSNIPRWYYTFDEGFVGFANGGGEQFELTY